MLADLQWDSAAWYDPRQESRLNESLLDGL